MLDIKAVLRYSHTMRVSRLSGFFQFSVEQRRTVLQQQGALAKQDGALLDCGGLSLEKANALIENVIGCYTLPLAIGTNFQINGKDHLVPMCIEEPSVVAGASRAALLARAGGGFFASADPPIMIGQIQLLDVMDPKQSTADLLAQKETLLEQANQIRPSLVARGGGVRDMIVRSYQIDKKSVLVVHLLIDCRDAMGANMVNSICESMAPLLAHLVQGRAGLCILSNLADHRLVRVNACIPADAMETPMHVGRVLIDRIVEASVFAEMDPYRACTHNKGIMNGIDAVMLATGNDWRGIEAGAHAFASQTGMYRPLATWKKDPVGNLVGELTLPMAVGIVGGTMGVHPVAKMALAVMDVKSSADLAMIAASVGLATNLAALRALTDTGIQQAHMPLHHRSDLYR